MSETVTAQPETEKRAMTAAGRYEQLAVNRTVYLDRAREAATLTIPALMPPSGATASSPLTQPFQSIGADGVNSLSAKLLLALFPPGTGFFRFTMDDFTVEKLSAKAVDAGMDGEDARAKYEEALAKCERAITNRMEQKGNRKENFEVFQHLIVTGNALVFIKPDGGEKMFPLDRYVVKRDLDGNVLEIIVKETIALVSAPKRVREVLATQPSSPANDTEKNVDIYTWVKRTDKGSWKVHQEVEGSIIPGTKGSYPKDRSAWLALRWRAIPGEDYGRGRVEEYIGDTRSAESLQQSMVEFAAQAAKVNWLVDPNGTTDKEKVADAPNGAVYHGSTKDITVLMLEKGQDFTVAKAVFDDVKKRLERAFLNSNSIQRDAERVTAEEIRILVAELEKGLGGVYTLFADDFQRPLAVRLWHQMMASGDLPQMPSDIVAPQVITGLEGLGRQTDGQKLRTLFQDVSAIFGPEAAAQWANISGYITRQGASMGVDTTGVVRTQAEVQQAQKDAADAEQRQKLGPAGIKAATDLAIHATSGAGSQPQS